MIKNEETIPKTDLKSLTKSELFEFCKELGLPRYRTDQIFQWLYEKGASNFEEMTNLPKDLRTNLDEIAFINRIELTQQQRSTDGTIKFLFTLRDEGQDFKIEAVLIPDFFPDGVADRLTRSEERRVGKEG